MKNKIILYLVLLISTLGMAQTQVFNVPVKMKVVSTLTPITETTPVLILGADGLVQKTTVADIVALGGGGSTPNIDQVLTAGYFSTSPAFVLNSLTNLQLGGTTGQINLNSSGLNLGSYTNDVLLFGKSGSLNMTSAGFDFAGYTLFQSPVAFQNPIRVKGSLSSIDFLSDSSPTSVRAQLSYSDSSGLRINSSDGKKITLGSTSTNSTSGLFLDAGGWGQIAIDQGGFKLNGNINPVNIVGSGQMNGEALTTVNSFKTINGENIVGSGDIVVGGGGGGSQNIDQVLNTGSTATNKELTFNNTDDGATYTAVLKGSGLELTNSEVGIKSTTSTAGLSVEWADANQSSQVGYGGFESQGQNDLGTLVIATLRGTEGLRMNTTQGTGAYDAILRASNITDSHKYLELPNKSGTLATLDDITGGGSQTLDQVLTEGNTANDKAIAFRNSSAESSVDMLQDSDGKLLVRGNLGAYGNVTGSQLNASTQVNTPNMNIGNTSGSYTFYQNTSIASNSSLAISTANNLDLNSGANLTLSANDSTTGSHYYTFDLSKPTGNYTIATLDDITGGGSQNIDQVLESGNTATDKDLILNSLPEETTDIVYSTLISNGYIKFYDSTGEGEALLGSDAIRLINPVDKRTFRIDSSLRNIISEETLGDRVELDFKQDVASPYKVTYKIPQKVASATGVGQLYTLATTDDFKTINGESIVGSGDIVISGGGSQNIDQVLNTGNTALDKELILTTENELGVDVKINAYDLTYTEEGQGRNLRINSARLNSENTSEEGNLQTAVISANEGLLLNQSVSNNLGYYMTLKASTITDSNKILELPNKSGTVAITEDQTLQAIIDNTPTATKNGSTISLMNGTGDGTNTESFLTNGLSGSSNNQSTRQQYTESVTDMVGLQDGDKVRRMEMNATGINWYFKQGSNFNTLAFQTPIYGDGSKIVIPSLPTNRSYIVSVAEIFEDETTVALSATTLNSTYSQAQKGDKVNCLSITGGALQYEKTTTGWIQHSITVVP